MGAFATDHTVCLDDDRRLRAAMAGELESLITVCERFEVPLLAAAMRATGSVPDAFARVEPTLSMLCNELLEGRLAPSDWSRRGIELLQDLGSIPMAADDDPQQSEQTLSAIGSLPRIARRRAVRQALPTLPLPALTALLLRHYRGYSPAEMVGLVAETEGLVRQCLAQADRQLAEVLNHVPSAANSAD